MDQQFVILPVKLPLSVVVSFPIFGKLDNYDLVSEVHNLIKDAVHNDQDIAAFVRKMRNLASYWDMWGYGSNWKQVLGSLCALLITRRYWVNIRNDPVGRGRVRRTHPAELQLRMVEQSTIDKLLGITRNNEEHNAFYTAMEKAMMKCFRKVDGKWWFDKELYAKLWNKMMPQLELFLFWQCRTYRNIPAFKKIYHCFPEGECYSGFGSLRLDSECVRLLNDALQDQVDQGGLKARIRIGRGNAAPILELRALPRALVRWRLDGNDAQEIKITEEFVTCKWYDRYNNSAIVKHYRVTQNASGMEFPGCILIAESLAMVRTAAFLEERKRKLKPGSRFVVFISQDGIDGVGENITEKLMEMATELAGDVEVVEDHANLQDLSTPIYRYIVSEGVFNVQGRGYKTGEIFPRQNQNGLLNCINGDVLNSLLRKTAPELFPTPILPECVGDRKIHRRVEFPLTTLDSASNTEIFVVLDNPIYEFLYEVDFLCKKNTRDEILVVESTHEFVLDLLGSDTKIFLLQTSQLGIGPALSPHLFRGLNLHNKNVHCFRYTGASTIEWLFTQGNQTLLERRKPTFRIERGEMSQEEAIQEIVNGELSNKKLVIFAGDSEEKSLALLRLARKLLNNFVGHFVFAHKIRDLMTFIFEEGGETPTWPVIKVALKRLLGKTDLEQCLIQCALEGSNSFVKLEVFFDGWEGVDIDIPSVVRVFEIISNELHSIRVWTPLSNKTVDEYRSRFDSACLLKFAYLARNELRSEIDFWHSCLNGVEAPNLSDAQARERLRVPFSVDSELGRSVWMEREFIENLVQNQDEPFSRMIRKLVECYVQKYLNEEEGLTNMNGSFAKEFLEQVHRFHTCYAVKFMSPKLLSARTENDLLPFEEERTPDNIARITRVGVLKSINPIEFCDRNVTVYYWARFISNQRRNMNSEPNSLKTSRSALLPTPLLVAVIFFAILYFVLFSIIPQIK